MTLLISVVGQESIWLLADRRLSVPGHPPQDDGCKLVNLETTDGVAILGYAGLGATANGTQLSAWMSSVLRGRNLPLEQSLSVVARAVRDQIPRHMRHVPKGISPIHAVIAPAFLKDEPRLYSIGLAVSADGMNDIFQFMRHEELPRRPPRVAVGGSGQKHLMRDEGWRNNLTRLVKAHDRAKASPQAVADYLAEINAGVARLDDSVGSRCIVQWRFRKGGPKGGGGGQQFYTDTTPDPSSPAVPTIATGIDLMLLLQPLVPHMEKMMQAMLSGEPPPEIDSDELNAALARLPHVPEEKLR